MNSVEIVRNFPLLGEEHQTPEICCFPGIEKIKEIAKKIISYFRGEKCATSNQEKSDSEISLFDELKKALEIEAKSLNMRNLYQIRIKNPSLNYLDIKKIQLSKKINELSDLQQRILRLGRIGQKHFKDEAFVFVWQFTQNNLVQERILNLRNQISTLSETKRSPKISEWLKNNKVTRNKSPDQEDSSTHISQKVSSDDGIQTPRSNQTEKAQITVDESLQPSLKDQKKSRSNSRCR